MPSRHSWPLATSKARCCSHIPSPNVEYWQMSCMRTSVPWSYKLHTQSACPTSSMQQSGTPAYIIPFHTSTAHRTGIVKTIDAHFNWWAHGLWLENHCNRIWAIISRFSNGSCKDITVCSNCNAAHQCSVWFANHREYSSMLLVRVLLANLGISNQTAFSLQHNLEYCQMVA